MVNFGRPGFQLNLGCCPDAFLNINLLAVSLPVTTFLPPPPPKFLLLVYFSQTAGFIYHFKQYFEERFKKKKKKWKWLFFYSLQFKLLYSHYLYISTLKNAHLSDIRKKILRIIYKPVFIMFIFFFYNHFFDQQNTQQCKMQMILSSICKFDTTNLSVFIIQ